MPSVRPGGVAARQSQEGISCRACFVFSRLRSKAFGICEIRARIRILDIGAGGGFSEEDGLYKEGFWMYLRLQEAHSTCKPPPQPTSFLQSDFLSRLSFRHLQDHGYGTL